MGGPYLSEEVAALAAILLGGASLRLVLSHKREKALLPYILDTIWLWSSFAVAMGLATEYLAEEHVIFTLIGIVLTSAVGGTILKLAGKEKVSEETRTLRLELTAPKDDRRG